MSRQHFFRTECAGHCEISILETNPCFCNFGGLRILSASSPEIACCLRAVPACRLLPAASYEYCDLRCLETQTIDAYLPRAGGISPRLKSRLSNKSAINLNPGSTTAGAACVSSAVGGAHRRWRALAARRCARPAAAAHLPVQKSVGCAGVPAAGGCIPSHTSKQILDQ
jgi:hypothetical protein